MATKHGREVRQGVFQIGKSGVKNSCFALALLVGRSYLQKDDIYYKLERNRNHKLTELYTDDVITNVYTCSGVCVGPVRTEQLCLFYENYLRPLGLDLVVFSKKQSDSIVYDSRLDEDKKLHRVTNDVIFLWLNDGHYDLILSPYKFSRCNSNNFCLGCMRYFLREETKAVHVCRTTYTCLRCYSCAHPCSEQEGVLLKCTSCDIIFYNQTCFHNHLTQRVFKNSWGTPESTCQHFFFCKTCHKIVTRKTTLTTKKKIAHRCDEMFCTHCNAMKKKDHNCYMKESKYTNTSHTPRCIFTILKRVLMKTATWYLFTVLFKKCVHNVTKNHL